MNYRFELLPGAITDVEEVFLWYRAISPHVCENFQRHLEVSLQEIQRSPFLFHSLTNKARCKRLKRFPYLIVYVVKGNLISVVAIIHEKRNPQTWKRRIRRK